MNDLTLQEADALVKARWGRVAGASVSATAKWVWVGTGYDARRWSGATWNDALRASMQSPMSDKDAELEARLRWGMEAKTLPPGRRENCESFVYTVIGNRRHGWGSTWEEAFANAGWRQTIGPTATPSELTPAEATAEAKRLFGPNAYAFPAVGDAPFSAGRPGVTFATGDSFRDALRKAEIARTFQALATAFGVLGVTILRDRNKAVGQALTEPPTWAYAAAWRNAVMAAVEWANNRPNPFALPRSYSHGRLPTVLRAYHDDRHRMCEAAARKRQEDTFAAAICAAYERGRPGGGR